MKSLTEPEPSLSKMEISGPAIADGISEAVVTLTIMNRRGSPLAGMKPVITVSGTNNVMIPCTTGSPQGVSICRILSTTAEWKVIRVIIPFEMESGVNFTPPAPLRVLFGIVSGASMQTLPSGRKILATSGITEGPISLHDNGGTLRSRTSHLSTIIPETP